MSEHNLSPVTIITGGGTGIGAACARRLSAEGARVILIGRRIEPIASLAQEIGAIALAGDVSNTASWQLLSKEIATNGQIVDRVICCAGGMGMGKITDMSDADWQQSLESNLTSAFATARACLPELIKTRGNIVFVASIASLAAGPDVCGYVTAKHALLGLMRSVARDYGPLGVRANAVCPGWVRTPMADEEMLPLMDAHRLTLEQAYQYVCRDVPLRRPATADEIAAICQFVSSPAASILTGATLVADGGSTIVDVPTLAFNSL